MLVLSRKVGERIVIADNIWLEVLEIRWGRIKVGITAPPEVTVNRAENVVFGPPAPARQEEVVGQN